MGDLDQTAKARTALSRQARGGRQARERVVDGRRDDGKTPDPPRVAKAQPKAGRAASEADGR
jgi:hypothetical protein